MNALNFCRTLVNLSLKKKLHISVSYYRREIKIDLQVSAMDFFLLRNANTALMIHGRVAKETTLHYNS